MIKWIIDLLPSGRKKTREAEIARINRANIEFTERLAEIEAMSDFSSPEVEASFKRMLVSAAEFSHSFHSRTNAERKEISRYMRSGNFGRDLDRNPDYLRTKKTLEGLTSAPVS